MTFEKFLKIELLQARCHGFLLGITSCKKFPLSPHPLSPSKTLPGRTAMRRDALSRTSAAGPPAAWREMSRMVWGVHFSANDRAHGLKRKAFQTGNALKGGGAWGVAVFSPSPQTIREAPQTHAAACGGSPRGLAKSPAREVEKKGTPAPAGHRNRGWHGAVRAPCYTATVNGMIVLRPRPTANGPGSTAI